MLIVLWNEPAAYQTKGCVHLMEYIEFFWPILSGIILVVMISEWGSGWRIYVAFHE